MDDVGKKAYGVLKRLLLMVGSVKNQIVSLMWVAEKEFELSYRASIPMPRRLWLWRHRFLTSSGVLYDFEEYGVDDYLPDLSRADLGEVNGNASAFSDYKRAFDRLLIHNHAEALPEIYGMVAGGDVMNVDSDRINSKPDDWIEQQIDEHGKIVLKPEDGRGGDDVFVLDRGDGTLLMDGEPTETEEVTKKISGTTYLISAFVDQAKYASEIYPHSANTIRFITVWDYESNEPYVADAIHRFGVDASAPVDNWDKGGLSAGIDLETGTLQKATWAPNSPTLDWFESHPETNARIEGVEIPGWTNIQSEVCQMAAELRQMPMIAWDVVVTEDGFKVIEGNSRPTIDMMQVHGPLLTDERTRRFFAQHDIL